MIAANYTAHLYCDCEECNSGWRHPDNSEFIGSSCTECAKAARADGWRISQDRTRAYAPNHKINRGKP